MDHFAGGFLQMRLNFLSLISHKYDKNIIFEVANRAKNSNFDCFSIPIAVCLTERIGKFTEFVRK